LKIFYALCQLSFYDKVFGVTPRNSMRLPNFHAHAPDLSQHRFKGLNKFKDKNRFLQTGQIPSLVLFLLKRLQ